MNISVEVDGISGRYPENEKESKICGGKVVPFRALVIDIPEINRNLRFAGELFNDNNSISNRIEYYRNKMN